MAKSYGTGAILEVAIVGDLFGSRTMTLLHYRALQIEGQRDWNLDLPGFDVEFRTATDSLVSNYQDVTSEDWKMAYVRYQLIYPVRYAHNVFLTTGETGTLAEPSLPANVSAVLNKKNDETGPHNRGQVHMPGLTIPSVADGALTPGAIALYTNLADKLNDTINQAQLPAPPGTWQPCIFNRTAPIASKEFTSVTIEPTVRVMRRRTLGVGI